MGREKRGSSGKELLLKGYPERFIEYLQSHLHSNPGDGDAWYALWESLSKIGRFEEGYRAFRRGRDLFRIAE